MPGSGFRLTNGSPESRAGYMKCHCGDIFNSPLPRGKSGPRPAHQRRSGMKSDWSRKFDEPIPLPKGRQLVNLKDAGTYITKLPAAEHEAQEWQAAMEALILVATAGGPTMFARIGIMRALNRHVARVFNPDRKDHLWGRRKLARDR